MPRHGVHVPVASAHDVKRRNRLNARMNATGIETNLPCIRRKHIAAKELAPMHVVPKGRGKQTDAVTAFVEKYDRPSWTLLYRPIRGIPYRR